MLEPGLDWIVENVTDKVLVFVCYGDCNPGLPRSGDRFVYGLDQDGNFVQRLESQVVNWQRISEADK